MLSSRNKKSSRGPYALVALLLELSVYGYAQVVTAVEGESWLVQRHRTFAATSMGKSSGVYGPAASMPDQGRQRIRRCNFLTSSPDKPLDCTAPTCTA